MFVFPTQTLLGQVPIDRPFTPHQVPLSKRQLTHLVDDGHLRRVLRGVYAVTELPDTLGTRARALSLIVPRGVVITDVTAAWLHGVDALMPGQHLVVPPVHAFQSGTGSRVRRDLIDSGKRMLSKRDVIEIDGVRVSTPLRTACDLGRNRFVDRSFAAAEAMVRAGVERDAIQNELQRFKGFRWVRNLRAVAPWLDSRPQSIAESLTRQQWIWTTAPYPVPQIPVPNPYGNEWFLDMGVEELYFAVEYDGPEWHGDPDQQERDRTRRGWMGGNTPWLIKIVEKKNIYGKKRDFDFLLPGWIVEARRTLPARMQRGGRWYDDIGA